MVHAAADSRRRRRRSDVPSSRLRRRTGNHRARPRTDLSRDSKYSQRQQVTYSVTRL